MSDHQAGHSEWPAWARLVTVLAARIAIGTAVVAVLWSVIPVAFGWTSVVVTSGSMGPRLRSGDVAIASPATGVQMVPGQPVLADNPVRPGKLLLHRVIRRNTDGSLVTKGDANPSEDSTPVPAASVVGRPRLLVRYIGLPVYWHGVGEHRKVAVTGVVGALLLLVASRRTDEEEIVAGPVPARHRRRPPAHRRPPRWSDHMLAIRRSTRSS
ncbi:signal peptidase I [Actinoplanes xinjiangensis]|uniref:signal peptidase I n=1 Tax=Actinoplanes xinjiangensis TaxID=512350 RepID=UPI00130E5BAD|nr:signal peptidase I [Actinoplanes xinjiangensis]